MSLKESIKENNIYNIDCISGMKQIDDNFIDSCFLYAIVKVIRPE